MPTILTPYLVWIKIAAIAVVLAVVGYGGYSYGSAKAHDEDNTAYSKLQKEYGDAKVQWANTLATADAQALDTLQSVEKKNKAESDAKQAKIDSLTAKYQTTLKDLQHAHTTALANVTNPHDSADPVTSGLWVDADAATCTSDQDPGGRLSVTSEGRLQPGDIRCRLSVSTATRLVDRAAEAQEVVTKLNLCVGQIQEATKAATPAGPPTDGDGK